MPDLSPPFRMGYLPTLKQIGGYLIIKGIGSHPTPFNVLCQTRSLSKNLFMKKMYFAIQVYNSSVEKHPYLNFIILREICCF